MELNKIYIGYDKSYNELLLEDRGSYYLDLLTDNIMFDSDLYLNLLQPILMLDEKYRNRMISSVKRIYKKDRSQILNTEDIYVGKVSLVTNVITNYSENEVSIRGEIAPVDNNALLYYIDRGNYKNLVTGEEYFIPELEKMKVGNIYIRFGELKKLNYEMTNGLYLCPEDYRECEFWPKKHQTKKKIIESYYRLYEKGVK